MPKPTILIASLVVAVSGCAYIDTRNGEQIVGESGIPVETSPIERVFQTEGMMLDSLPIGAIIPYSPPNGARLPENWMLCDGSVVSDPESPFHGQRLPNLLDNRFLMGTSTALHQTGGQNTIPTVQGIGITIPDHYIQTTTAPNHDHTGLTGIEENNGVVRPLEQVGETNVRITEQGHRHEIIPDGRHSHTAVASHNPSLTGNEPHNHGGDNRPRWFGVYYIIKIR